MKKNTLLLCILIVVGGCSESKNESSKKKSFNEVNDYSMEVNANTFSDPIFNEEDIKLLKLDNKRKGLLEMSESDNFLSECSNIPKDMRDLRSGLQKFFLKFTSKSGIDLKVLGYGGANLEKKEVLLIVDFIQFKDINCSGKNKRFGVGARLFLNIKECSSKININNLPQLAAAVELDKATVTYNISTIGITGDKILDLLPTGADFNVESYAKVVSSIDQIIKIARDNTSGIEIEPQIIPIPEK